MTETQSTSAAQAARHLFLSERRFRELLDEEIIERAGRGAYDLDRVRRQYIEHLRSSAAGRGGVSNEAALAAERIRLARGQADAQEMKNAAARRELLPRDEVHTAVGGAFARVRAKLLALPTKLAPVVLGMKTAAEVKQRLETGIHEALRELATTEVVAAPRDREPPRG